MTSASDTLLDDLLAEALAIELRKRRGTHSVQRLRLIGEVVRASFSEDSWRAARVLHIIHNNQAVGSLGYFQEYAHLRTAARKLVRIDGEPARYEVEIVSGREWAGPCQHVVDPPTEGEIAAIRAHWQPHAVQFAWKHLEKIRFKNKAAAVNRTLPRTINTDELLRSLSL